MKIKIPWLASKNISSGRVGIAVGPDGLSIAHVDGSGVTDFCQIYPDAGDGRELLKELVGEHGWQGKLCSLVLHPIYYQMTLAEAPPVEGEEMAEAIRWRLKEFVDYPLEEAAIDHFMLPEDAYRGRKSMLYAAVMRKHSLEGLVEPIEESGLELDCIEVSELALHNLCGSLPEVRGGTAILYLLENEGFINLVEDGEIYLSRNIDIGFSQFETGDRNRHFESLLLEVQRSLDFYESQLGKGIIANLYYSSVSSASGDLGEYLSNQLGLNVAPLNIESLINGDFENDQLAACITAVGAAVGPERNKELANAAH